MENIVVLDGIVADKIAAGEVIERPASVVKELVENAIDAGSHHIHIEVGEAGKRLIRVKDDGAGIHAEQAALAFSRHATSKIREPSDLAVIRTLGFRGEALPSIASVARVELITHSDGAASSVKVDAAGGQVETIEWHAPKGTEVVVRDLFYNTPARHKFLKSDTAERRAIVEYVTKVALAHPHIAFSLVIEGDERVTTPGTNHLKETIGALFGRNVISDLVAVKGHSPFGHISGYVGKPSLARGNRGSCFVFINGRWVENRTLYVAVEKGFETLLAHRRYPFAVLHIEMDPSLVDVNVHPAKTEVRFRDEREIFRLIMRSVRSSLIDSDLTIGLTSQSPKPTENYVSDRNEPYIRNGDHSMQSGLDERVQSRLMWGIQSQTKSSETRSELPRKDYSIDRDGKHEVEWIPGKQKDIPVQYSPREILLEAAVIGQLANTYLIVEVPDGIWLIDQHVAHERILFEEFLNTQDDDEYVVPSQELLAPEQLVFSPVQAATLEQAKEMLEKGGFLLEPFGGNHYLLRAVPVTALHAPGTMLVEMIEEMASQDDNNLSLKERTAASFACRAAVKAGDLLQPEESTAIVRSLALLENPFACPHGRPIIVRVTREEIERRFERR